MDYKKLGLKAGLELHQRLLTQHKLFCNCSTCFPDKPIVLEVKRKMHPIMSELGERDITAQFEYLRDRTFIYQTFPRSTCLICLDEEPPNPLNPEALKIGLEIALLLNMTIPEEIHVMRKQILDGSSCCSFQRTCVIGRNGYVKYKGRKIEITHVSLEEESCGIVKEDNGRVIYRLDRQGIPLVEVATGLLEGYTPEEIQEIAYTIGIILRSTGHVMRGIGVIRQDINVSIKGGARVEIKGVQELGSLAKVIELEVRRQVSLPKVEREVRAVNPDGTTRFTRPLPGAARMYPESDLPPIPVSKEFIEKIKKKLPEPWTKKLVRFKKKLKLSDELSKQILKSDYLDLFEKIVKKYRVNPSVAANVFVSTLKDLKKRENVKVEKLEDKDFEELFKLLKERKLMKESIPDILKYKVKHPKQPMIVGIKKLGLQVISNKELMRIVKDVIKKNKGKPEGKIIGLVMSRVRGRVKSENVVRIVKRLLKS